MSGGVGKVVAITGAGSGIGRATALLLAERGAKLVLGACRADCLEAVAKQIGAVGGEAAYVPIDVKRRDDLSSLAALACERFGKLDVLVSNAGIGPVSLLDELRVDDWGEMIDINVKGVLYGIAAALPVFRRQGFGQFVNIASPSGLITKPIMRCIPGRSSPCAPSRKACGRSWRQAARDDHHSRIRQDGLCRLYDEPGSEGANRWHDGEDGDLAGCDCPRHRVRDRAAGGRRRGRDRRTADSSGLAQHPEQERQMAKTHSFAVTGPTWTRHASNRPSRASQPQPTQVRELDQSQPRIWVLPDWWPSAALTSNRRRLVRYR